MNRLWLDFNVTFYFVEHYYESRPRMFIRLHLPLPYNGTTLSFPIPALQTGQICRLGLVSSHVWRHGQQNRWPHIEITASLATSKQILHSKAAFALDSSSLLFGSVLTPDVLASSLSLLLLSELYALLLVVGVSCSLILGLAPPLSPLFCVASLVRFLKKIGYLSWYAKQIKWLSTYKTAIKLTTNLTCHKLLTHHNLTTLFSGDKLTNH